MNCPKCNAEIKEGAKFCVNCGAKVELPAEEVVVAAPSVEEAPAAPVVEEKTAEVEEVKTEAPKEEVKVEETPVAPKKKSKKPFILFGKFQIADFQKEKGRK